jgi:hypothetical protein
VSKQLDWHIEVVVLQLWVKQSSSTAQLHPMAKVPRAWVARHDEVQVYEVTLQNFDEH